MKLRRKYNKVELTLLCLHKPRQYVVTRDAVSYPDHMAQYVVGVVLARERHLMEHHHNQQNKLWYGHLQYGRRIIRLI